MGTSLAGRRGQTWVGVMLVLSSLGLTACGNIGNTVAEASSGAPSTGAAPQSGASTPTASTPTAAAGAPSAQIKGSIVTPATLNVSTGQTVEIKNLDPFSHNLEDKVHRLYDGDIQAKSTGELTAPANPGTYVFIDRGHSAVKLTLKVR
jgi:plastocyanin